MSSISLLRNEENREKRETPMAVLTSSPQSLSSSHSHRQWQRGLGGLVLGNKQWINVSWKRVPVRLIWCLRFPTALLPFIFYFYDGSERLWPLGYRIINEADRWGSTWTLVLTLTLTITLVSTITLEPDPSFNPNPSLNPIPDCWKLLWKCHVAMQRGTTLFLTLTSCLSWAWL